MSRLMMGLLLLTCAALTAASGCYVHVRDHGHRRQGPVYREHRHHCDSHCGHGHQHSTGRGGGHGHGRGHR